MECLAQDELDDLSSRQEALVQKLTLALLPRDPRDERSVMLEIRAGAGGDEACLWAGDLARMYERYSQKLGWSVQPVSSNEADLGGFRELILSVKGDSVFSQLKFEAGVHRVQRVPATHPILLETRALASPSPRARALQADLPKRPRLLWDDPPPCASPQRQFPEGSDKFVSFLYKHDSALVLSKESMALWSPFLVSGCRQVLHTSAVFCRRLFLFFL